MHAFTVIAPMSLPITAVFIFVFVVVVVVVVVVVKEEVNLNIELVWVLRPNQLTLYSTIFNFCC